MALSREAMSEEMGYDMLKVIGPHRIDQACLLYFSLLLETVSCVKGFGSAQSLPSRHRWHCSPSVISKLREICVIRLAAGS
jgi:hypothetical protein